MLCFRVANQQIDWKVPFIYHHINQSMYFKIQHVSSMEIDVNWDATSNFQFPGYSFIFDTEQELVLGIPQNLKFIHRFSPISQEVQLQSFWQAKVTEITQNIHRIFCPTWKEISKLNPLKQLHPVGSFVTKWWSCVLGQYRTAMVGTWRYWVTMRQ